MRRLALRVLPDAGREQKEKVTDGEGIEELRAGTGEGRKSRLSTLAAELKVERQLGTIMRNKTAHCRVC